MVEAWSERCYAARDTDVSLADIALLAELATELPPPNLASNKVYHLLTRLGRDTTGQAGF